MTVGELIEKLKTMDSESEIAISENGQESEEINLYIYHPQILYRVQEIIELPTTYKRV